MEDKEIRKLICKYIIRYKNKKIQGTEKKIHTFFRPYVKAVCSMEETLWNPETDIKKILPKVVDKEKFPYITKQSVMFIEIFREVFTKQKKGVLPFKEMNTVRKLSNHLTVHRNIKKMEEGGLVFKIIFQNKEVSNSCIYYLLPTNPRINKIYNELVRKHFYDKEKD